MGSVTDYTTLLAELTLEEKVKLLSGKDFSSVGGAERLGIPPIQVRRSLSPVSKKRWPGRAA